MSALAIVFRRDGAPPDISAMDSLLGDLSHHGPDGRRRHSAGPCEIGYLQWSTLPDADEPMGPWRCHRTGQLAGFCGRLDNRQELLHALGRREAMADDRLAWECYLAWGERSFARMIGRFVIAAADPADGTLLLARDALGDEPLYYHLGASTLVAASEPWAVCRAARLPPQPDRERIVDFIQNRWPTTGHSFFDGVKELPPGHFARVGSRSWRCRRYWCFEPEEEWRSTPSGTVYEAFRERLAEAVDARLRSRHPVAVSLSGGLDSTSVAWAAARSTGLRGYSWRFSRFRESDEGNALRAAVASLGIDHAEIDGDDRVTRFDADGIPEGLDANGPLTNSVHGLKQALYRRASTDGYRVILTGDAADELFLGRWYWLRDLIAQPASARPSGVPASILRQLLGGDGEAWQALRLLFSDRIGFRRHLPSPRPRWLSREAWHDMPPYAQTELVPGALRNRAAYDYALGAYRSTYATYELGANARSGVDRRCPYRDRRLVSFILSLPASYYSRPPENKLLIRRAFNGLLPGEIIRQPKAGSLGVLLGEGLAAGRDVILPAMTQGRSWRHYLQDTEVMTAMRDFRHIGDRKPVPDGVLWNAICLQGWLRLLGGD